MIWVTADWVHIWLFYQNIHDSSLFDVLGSNGGFWEEIRNAEVGNDLNDIMPIILTQLVKMQNDDI